MELFPLMFPDSDIASKMRLQRTKIAYTIVFGLAPYFFRELQNMCSACDYIVIGFDESLNKVAQKGQMDVFVRFWNDENNRVCTRYYGSAFLGHATAADIMTAFLEEAIKGLDIAKLLQISMDGPNVNKKFLQDIKAKIKEENCDANGPILLDLGSCGLHTIHNAFKKAMKASGWDLTKFTTVQPDAPIIRSFQDRIYFLLNFVQYVGLRISPLLSRLLKSSPM